MPKLTKHNESIEVTDEELAALERFEAFCKSDQKLDEELDELDWYALSIGFFLGCGITNTDSLSKLALYARYTAHYWC